MISLLHCLYLRALDAVSNAPAVPSIYPTVFRIGAQPGSIVAKLLGASPEKINLTWTIGGTDAALFAVSGDFLVVKSAGAGGTPLTSGSKSITVTLEVCLALKLGWMFGSC